MSDRLMNPYSRYGSAYSNDSWRNPYATNPTRLSNGGELSANPYRKDATSNPYGRYGSPYSSNSVNNPYGAGNPYLNRPLYVFPSSRSVLVAAKIVPLVKVACFLLKIK
jgi:hypothetical protein